MKNQNKWEEKKWKNKHEKQKWKTKDEKRRKKIKWNIKIYKTKDK